MSFAIDSLTKIEQILTKIEDKIIRKTARKVALRSLGASLKLISDFIIATRTKNRSGTPKWKDTRLYNPNNGKKLKEIICLIATGMLFGLYYAQCLYNRSRRANCNAVGIHSKNSMMKKVIPIILIMCVTADYMKKQMDFAVVVI